MKKYLLTIVFLLIISCNYKKDKLKIQNNTEKEVYFMPFMKSKSDNNYHQIAIGGIVRSGDFSFPLLQKVGRMNKNMSEELNLFSLDKKLYLVFYSSKYSERIHKMKDAEIMSNTDFKIQKYTLEELNRMNWEVEYAGD